MYEPMEENFVSQPWLKSIRYAEKYSTSQIFGETQVGIPMRYHFMFVEMAFIKRFKMTFARTWRKKDVSCGK